jgi:hypothetical protein
MKPGCASFRECPSDIHAIAEQVSSAEQDTAGPAPQVDRHQKRYAENSARTASGQGDLRTGFPRVISGLRRPIAIRAATSLNMNLPE